MMATGRDPLPSSIRERICDVSFELTWHGAPISDATVVIGIFDGVHSGHQLIIKKALAKAAPVVALTFQPHPLEILNPDQAPTELLSLNDRIQELIHQGVTSVAVITFTKEFAAMSPESFITEVLVERLHASAVVVGSNFRYGAKAAGDIQLLERIGSFEVNALDLASELGDAVSSTRIRSAIVGGNIEIAWELLTRPHQLVGPVVHGEKRGRKIGYPTANIQVSERATVPSDGVYAGWLSVGTHRWPAAISIGTNPTFAGMRSRQVEAYALDQENLDLYDQVAKVEFGWRLRDTIKFSGLDPLLAQMKIDCDKARELTQSHA